MNYNKKVKLLNNKDKYQMYMLDVTNFQNKLNIGKLNNKKQNKLLIKQSIY